MPKIFVSNKRRPKSDTLNSLRVQIGRPNPLGNPYKIGEDGNRKTVIAKYEMLLRQKLLVGRAFDPMTKAFWQILQDFQAGKDIIMECWCAPKPCHGDVIKKYLLEKAGVKNV